jgi:hypothetical protein
VTSHHCPGLRSTAACVVLLLICSLPSPVFRAT